MTHINNVTLNNAVPTPKHSKHSKHSPPTGFVCSWIVVSSAYFLCVCGCVWKRERERVCVCRWFLHVLVFNFIEISSKCGHHWNANGMVIWDDVCHLFVWHSLNASPLTSYFQSEPRSSVATHSIYWTNVGLLTTGIWCMTAICLCDCQSLVIFKLLLHPRIGMKCSFDVSTRVIEHDACPISRIDRKHSPRLL